MRTKYLQQFRQAVLPILFFGIIELAFPLDGVSQTQKSNDLSRKKQLVSSRLLNEIRIPENVDSIQFIRLNIDSLTTQADNSEFFKKKLEAIDAEVLNIKAKQSVVLSNLIKQKKIKGINQDQKKQLDSLESSNKYLQKHLDSLAAIQILLQSQIADHSSKLTAQNELKKKYRNDLYTRITADAKRNWEILNQNLSVYKQQIKLQIDSVAPKLWPLSKSNSDSEIVKNGTIYFELYSKTHDINNQLIDLEKDYPEIQKRITQLDQIEILSKHPGVADTYLDSIFVQYVKDLAESFEKEKIHNDKFKASYDLYRITYKIRMDEVNRNWTAQSSNTKEVSADASVLTELTQALNSNSSLVPSVNVLASGRFGSGDMPVLGQAKVFLAAAGSDTNRLNNSMRFFIPEASDFGVTTDINFSFIPYKTQRNGKEIRRLGFNLSFYYLQKQLNEKNSTNENFNVSLIQTRLGSEIIVFQNALSLYFNLWGQYVGKGVEKYQENYIAKPGMQFYSEYGIKTFLTLSKKSDFNLLLDIRFIPINNYIKEFTDSKDKFIPLIKLGLVKDFDF